MHCRGLAGFRLSGLGFEELSGLRCSRALSFRVLGPRGLPMVDCIEVERQQTTRMAKGLYPTVFPDDFNAELHANLISCCGFTA